MKLFKNVWMVLATLTLTAPALAGHGKKMDIVDTAANAGTFETLIAAAKAAGLAGALKGDGPLTVFAPTDEAFSALPAGTIETLLKPENKDQLATILKYHVIAGKVGSGALADGARLETLAGVDAVISQTEGGFNIENARIVATDIDASNGVVHVIDRVILPPAQMSRSDSADAIRRAIDKGVPMFNHGNASATVAVYKAVSEELIRSGGLNSDERMRLQVGLEQAADTNNARTSAWRLRYALDDVNDSLHGGQMSAMSR
ncbi:MAG: fasciclin domain-containing protein [Pseudomonadota bacterium]